MDSAKYHGLLVIDKPSGLTSRQVVDRVQGCFPRRTRIGHTGTLDPLASGVLVLCVGVATRLAEYVQRMAKTYRTTLFLGARSDTDDADGTIEGVPSAVAPERGTVEQRLQEFVGEVEQVPPAYSAAKVTGRRAYELARRGRPAELSARLVRIDKIDIISFVYPHLELEIRCGKGTYIRSLVRDLGERLGCGAYVETLRRMSVGMFRVADAVRLDADPVSAQAALLPPTAAVVALPRVTLPGTDLARMRRGQPVPWNHVKLDSSAPSTEGEEIVVFDDVGSLAAVGIIDWEGRLLRPVKVLLP